MPAAWERKGPRNLTYASTGTSSVLAVTTHNIVVALVSALHTRAESFRAYHANRLRTRGVVPVLLRAMMPALVDAKSWT